MHQVRARIRLASLKHNLDVVKKLSPKSRVVSVIKANAYGHGITEAARALQDSDAFAVARMDEALLLRQQGIDKTIFLLEGVYDQDCYKLCEQHHLIPAVHCMEQFQWLQNYFSENNNSSLTYWLKLDTGMHRLGLQKTELNHLSDLLQALPDNRKPAGIMSHFACADEINHSFNQQQLELFEQLSVLPFKIQRKVQRSMANSAAIIAMPESHYDWVRPGIMLYGVSPFEDRAFKEVSGNSELELKPVMTLESELIAVKHLKKGDCIGYGSSWCCPEDMTIGVVGIGYGDGYPRHARPGTPVLMHKHRLPLVGRVSMDMVTINLQALYQHGITPVLGDRVILWGEGLPVEQVAQCSDTIAYELLCQITQRVTIEYE